MRGYKILAGFVMFFSLSAFADNTQQEIDHLIDYVAATECQYERNGTLHNGQEAVEHIQKKYNYFKKRIKSAEDFIKYSASQSTMSRKAYTVHCQGKPTQKTQDWLLAELANFRQTTN